MSTQEITPVAAASKPSSPTVTTGEWLLTYLLASVPVLGLVMLLVWATNPRTPASKANWAKATLLMLVVLVFVLFLAYQLLEVLSDYRHSIDD